MKFSHLPAIRKSGSKKDTPSQQGIQKEHTRITLRYALRLHAKKVVENTRFSFAEASILINLFWTLSDGLMFITNKTLKSFFSSTFACNNKEGVLIRGYQRLKSRYVYIDEFTHILSIMMLGTVEEQASHIFEIYDVHGFGFISKEEVLIFLRHSFDTGSKVTFTNVEKPVHDIAEYLIKKMNVRHQRIQRENFIQVVQENPLLMECCLKIWPCANLVEAFKKLVLYKGH